MTLPIPSRAEPLSTYWTLGRPESTAPLFSWAPYSAYLRLIDHALRPRLAVQRKQVESFRAELCRAGMMPRSLFLLHSDAHNTVASIDGCSAASSHLCDLTRKRTLLSAPDLMHLGYTLMCLGFYADAAATLSAQVSADPGIAAYALINRNLWHYGRTNDLDVAGLDLLDAIPRTATYFRVRFSLYQTLTVYLAQRGRREALLRISARGPSVLQDYQQTSSCPFFQNMVASRYYRATSYVPFVAGNNVELLRCAEKIAAHSEAAVPRDENDAIVSRENEFPMTETLARIHEHLGDHTRACSLLESIPHRIDQFDAKGWMQLGDFHARRGNPARAHECYEQSCVLGVPHGHIAWFKLGLSFERRGDHDAAENAYIRSLELEPSGFSPLAKLLELGCALNRLRIFELLEERIRRVIAAQSLTAPQRALLDRCISQFSSARHVSIGTSPRILENVDAT